MNHIRIYNHDAQRYDHRRDMPVTYNDWLPYIAPCHRRQFDVLVNIAGLSVRAAREKVRKDNEDE